MGAERVAKRLVKERVLSIGLAGAEVPRGDLLARPESSPRNDREFWLTLGALTVIYVTALYFAGQRFVWFDRTLHLRYRQSPFSAHALAVGVKVRQQSSHCLSAEPLLHADLWAAPLGLRLPSMVEFYLGSVAMLVYLRRKVATPVAAFAVLILWSSSSFYYATEARVYALVFLSFSCLLLSWDSATRRAQRTVALWCVAISTVVLLMSHVFASLCLAAFVVAELARYLRRRRPDYPLYAALVLPMAAMLFYIPLIRVYHGLILWPQFHASPRMAARFYYDAVDCVARALFAVSLSAMLLQQRSATADTVKSKLAVEDWTLFACMLLNPLLLNLLLMQRKGDFFGRYTLTTNVVIYGLIAVLFAVRLRFNKLSAYVATLLMLVMMVHSVHREWVKRPREANQTTLMSLRPDLPIVVSNGATWVEMNQHESPQVVARLYYIKDRAAAVKYDGTNYYYDFEALDDMQREGFPFKGSVEAYSAFIASHRQFLIFADPFEWLPLKLREDGAQFTLLLAYSGARPNNTGGPILASDPISDDLGDHPRVSFPTPYIVGSSPYIAKHVFLVTMPLGR